MTRTFRPCPWRLVVALLASAALPVGATFVTFESGQVRPLAKSPDGTRLFAVNTPDDQLEIFSVDGTTGDLTHTGSVPVGLEPVAVAARTNGEVWVVDHLSDSVSIVDVATSPPRVVRTLLVGDEPRDIVFAGTGGNRAFITTAHRGQNRPGDPQLTTPGVGRADVWVFNATSLGTSLGGDPLSILTLFCDTPRALAVGSNGATVYAAAFHSGNQTTALSEGAVCNGGAAAPACNVLGTIMPGGLPAPNTNFQGISGPETGLIVRFDGMSNHWEDQLGRNWDPAVRFTLPDRDVFAIDANDLAAVPTPFAHVGTILFNMIENPTTGQVYVSNTEARNEVRFEGPLVAGASTVRGHLHEARITVIDSANVLPVRPRHLNKHIDYAVVPSPAGVKDDSLAIPNAMALTGNGGTLYVAAFGSSKIGVFDTSALEGDTFVPSAADHIAVTGGGPSGLVLNELRSRLYAFTRFDNAVSVIDTGTRSEIAHLPLHNPEPASVVNGRRFLYDAALTSSNGEASCASCHVFGDFDSLGWDLGNPGDVPLANPNPFEFGATAPFNPLKGPMATQSLRGMANHGPMHWRGDRTGGNDPGGDPFDENAAFDKFNVAFGGLLGRTGPLTAAEMQAFTAFILQVTYPPNPIRVLTNVLMGAPQIGRDLYFGPITDVVRTCNGCHVLDPAAGFFGSDGEMSFENETQNFKIPHLRNLYQKIGMFGMPAIPFLSSGNNGPQGDQVRGFGFLHDGSIDTIFRFHGATVFSLSVADQQNVEQFMLAFDSDLAPIVGQQVTLTTTSGSDAQGRVTLLLDRDDHDECEVVAKGVLAGELRGWLRNAGGLFQGDRASEAPVTDAQLRAQATTVGQQRTYTCVPVGSGTRIGIDRDGDGFLDRDELDAGSDPADPASTPGGTTTTTTTLPSASPTLIGTTKLVLKDGSTPPSDPRKRKVVFKSVTKTSPGGNRIVVPTQGGIDDPRSVGATVMVYNSNGASTDLATVVLSSGGWKALGTTGYVYENSSSAAISKVRLKPDLLVIRGGKGAWPYTLDEPAQGRVAVQLVVGGVAWCAEAPARTDKVDKFIGQPKAPPPATCPATP